MLDLHFLPLYEQNGFAVDAAIIHYIFTQLSRRRKFV